jgi:hypothetical protein
MITAMATDTSVSARHSLERLNTGVQRSIDGPAVPVMVTTAVHMMLDVPIVAITGSAETARCTRWRGRRGKRNDGAWKCD